MSLFRRQDDGRVVRLTCPISAGIVRGLQCYLRPVAGKGSDVEDQQEVAEFAGCALGDDGDAPGAAFGFAFLRLELPEFSVSGFLTTPLLDSSIALILTLT